MKRQFLYASLALILVFELGVGWKLLTASAAADTDDTGYANLTVFTRALQLIRQDYIDEKKLAYR